MLLEFSHYLIVYIYFRIKSSYILHSLYNSSADVFHPYSKRENLMRYSTSSATIYTIGNATSVRAVAYKWYSLLFNRIRHGAPVYISN